MKLEDKTEFLQKNVVGADTLCCLCDFPLESRVPGGWSEHVIKAEHLFLANIYTNDKTKLMNIDNFEVYSKKVNQILDKLDPFCNSIEYESKRARKKGKQNPEVEDIVEKI